MKSSAKASDEIKSSVSFFPRSGISSQSDFIHASGFLPPSADLVEKSTANAVLFSGGGWLVGHKLANALLAPVRVRT